MYFCNTCGQPLCAPCREETHRAKMFARHEIVSLSKRTKDIHKKCRECRARLPRVCQAAPGRARLPTVPVPCSPARGALHHVLHREEVHALHQLLQGHAGVSSAGPAPAPCPVPRPDARARRESRAHCIDIETAYMQGCQRLDQAVMVGRDGGRVSGRGGTGVRCCRQCHSPPSALPGREGAADLHARGHRPPQGHDRGGAQQCQRGGGGHQLPLRPHAGAGQRPPPHTPHPAPGGARGARQDWGSRRGAGGLCDTGRPCRLQEQLSERKKTLLKAVQRCGDTG